MKFAPHISERGLCPVTGSGGWWCEGPVWSLGKILMVTGKDKGPRISV